MRRAIKIIFVCGFCMGWIGLAMPSTASAEKSLPTTPTSAAKGPVLLDLNPPLLSEPLKEEKLNEDNAPELGEDTTPSAGSNASARPKEATDAKPADPPAKEENPPSDAKNPLPLPAETTTPAENATQQNAADPQTPKGETAALTPLSEEMIALRNSVRQTLASYAKEAFNTRDNTATNVLDVCLAYGCNAEVRRDGGNGQRLNGITCLCWNYPCAGHEILRLCDGRIAPQIGRGYQAYPGQFLAVLALSRVPREYPIRVGDDVRKVDDLIEYEKWSCREGMDLSFKLIGLARYVPTDESWKNKQGHSWSISHLVREVLAAGGDKAPCGGTHRLMALSYVVDCRVKRGEPIDGQFLSAQKYIEEFRNHALQLANPDGTWHPDFFAYRGQGGAVVDQINSTGHILRWLVFTLPDDELQDAKIVRSVARLNALMADGRARGRNLPAASAREIAARMNALHALAIYDQRVFQPRDEASKPEGEKKDVAARSASSAK